jgi:hypothetical protein
MSSIASSVVLIGTTMLPFSGSQYLCLQIDNFFQRDSASISNIFLTKQRGTMALHSGNVHHCETNADPRAASTQRSGSSQPVPVGGKLPFPHTACINITESARRSPRNHIVLPLGCFRHNNAVHCPHCRPDSRSCMGKPRSRAVAPRTVLRIIAPRCMETVWTTFAPSCASIHRIS